MNEYKRAWMAAVDLLPEIHFGDSQPEQSDGQTVYDYVKSDIITGIAASVIMAGFKHAAQSQIKGRLGIAMRVGGRVGLRVVPVVGTAMAVYTIYKLIEDLQD